MSGELRVAGAQVPVTRDVPQNVATLTRAIGFARAEAADVLLTPEGSLSGYYAGFDPEEVGHALAQVTESAREAGVALALGTCFVEPDDGKCYNQVRFYEKDGTYLGFHSKTLRCGTVTGDPTGEIHRYAVQPLRTFELCGVTVGGLICNDMWANPGCTPMPDTYLARQLAAMGAKVILHAVNGGRGDTEFSRHTVWHFHQSNLLMRAKAAKVWVAVADNCAPMDLHCSVQCGVVNPEGAWVQKTEPKGEQHFVYTIRIAD